jgi:hypothetical protein
VSGSLKDLRVAIELGASAVFVAVVGTVVLLSPSAHADQASFVADVQGEGAFGQLRPSTTQVLGEMACQQIVGGSDTAISDFESAIVNDTHVSSADAVQFIALARQDLCPNAVGRSQDQVAPGPTAVPSASANPTSQYMRTESGRVRCAVLGDRAACEASGPGSTGFTQAPIQLQESQCQGSPCPGGIHSDLATVTSGGSFTWQVGNIGGAGEPWSQTDTTLSYGQTYHFLGWTIVSNADGTRIANDGTGHGMFVSIDNVSSF